MFSAFGSSMAPCSSPAACRSSPSFALGQRRPPRRHPSTDLEPGELPSADAYQPASTVVLAGTDDEPARMRFVIALTVEGLSLSDADLRAAIVEGLTRRFKHRCRPGHQRTACRRPGTLTGREGCRDGAVAAELAGLWPASSYTVMVMVHLPDELAEWLSAETARRRPAVAVTGDQTGSSVRPAVKGGHAEERDPHGPLHRFSCRNLRALSHSPCRGR